MGILKGASRLFHVGIFLCALSGFAMPATAFKLPIGFPEDFNGCSTFTDKNKRDTCCESVEKQCQSTCYKDFDISEPGNGAENVACTWGCDDALIKCKSGNKVKELIGWPGELTLPIPGVFIDGNKISTDDNVGIGLSTDSVVIEVYSDVNHRAESNCAALVTSCQYRKAASGDDAARKQCRPVVTKGAIECQICRDGIASGACKPCKDFAPVILSARPCENAGIRQRSSKPKY